MISESLLHTRLSLLVGDPIGSYTSDGTLFNYELRQTCIRNGYWNMIEFLSRLGGSFAPDFVKKENMLLVSLNNSTELYQSDIQELPPDSDVFEVILNDKYRIEPKKLRELALIRVGSLDLVSPNFKQEKIAYYYAKYDNTFHFYPALPRNSTLRIVYYSQNMYISGNNINCPVYYEGLLYDFILIEMFKLLNRIDKLKLYYENIREKLALISKDFEKSIIETKEET